MQTVDALRMCIFSLVQRVSVVLGEYHIRVRLLQVCSFNCDGQFQGLKVWSEQQGKALTHSFFTNLPNNQYLERESASLQLYFYEDKMFFICAHGVVNEYGHHKLQ